jgi:hypothetical protein
MTYPKLEKVIPSSSENITIDLLNKSSLNYTLRIVGGWVKDKLLNRKSRDLDFIVDCETMEQLFLITNQTFRLLESKYSPKLLENKTLFRRPYDIRSYGFLKMTLYGFEIDLEIMAVNRKITLPYVKL